MIPSIIDSNDLTSPTELSKSKRLIALTNLTDLDNLPCLTVTDTNDLATLTGVEMHDVKVLIQTWQGRGTSARDLD